MKDLKQLLKKRKIGAKVALDEKSVFFVFNKIIKEEYGKQGAEHIQPRFLKDKKIFAESDSSAWASEIWLNKARIIARVNEEIGSVEIVDIAMK